MKDSTMIMLTTLLCGINTIKVNPSDLCQMSYDIEGFKDQVNILEKTREVWETFRGLEVQDQVGTYQGRPVFKTSGNTLSEHLRECSEKAGTMIEFYNDKQQKQVNKLIRSLKIGKIMLYLTYNDGQVLWPSSGVAFQYNVLDAQARSRTQAKTYKGTVLYKCYDKTTKKETNEFSFVDASTNVKSLCVSQETSLIKEVAAFNTYVREETFKLEMLDPPIANITREIEEEMRNSSETIGANEGQCWRTKITPIKKTTYNTPPKIDSLNKVTIAKEMFNTFKTNYLGMQKKMPKILKKIRTATNINMECIPTGLGFFNYFTTKSTNMTAILSLIMTIAVTTATSGCCCCCLICVLIKLKKPKRERIIETYECNEQIPLSQRRQ